VTRHATGGAPEVRVVAVPYARVSPLAWVALIVLIGGVLWAVSATLAPTTSGDGGGFRGDGSPGIAASEPMDGPLSTIASGISTLTAPSPTATATSTPVPTATALPTPIPLSARYPACDRTTAPGTACWKHRLDVRTPTPIPDCTAVEGGLCVATGDESAHGRSETE
jgi:hypothetical protein